MKIIKIMAGLILALVLIMIGGAYYSGQQIAKILPLQLEKVNAQLAQSQNSKLLNLAVELESLQSGIFSSKATYNIIAKDLAEQLFDGEFKLKITSDIEHGPVPLSRLIKGKVKPVMHAANLKLDAQQQEALTEAWLELTGENSFPLTISYVVDYSGDASGSFNLAAIKHNTDKVEVDLAAFAIDFAIADDMTKYRVNAKLPSVDVLNNSVEDFVKISSSYTQSQPYQPQEDESITSIDSAEFSLQQQSKEQNIQLQIPKILFIKGGEFADDTAELSNLQFTSQAKASQQQPEVLLQTLQASLGKLVFETKGDKAELQDFVFKGGIDEDGPNLVAKFGYGVKQILFKKQPLLGFNLEWSLQDIPLSLYQQFQTMLVALVQNKDLDEKQWLQLSDQILLEQPQIRYDLGVNTANAAATASASLILQKPAEFSFANQDALSQAKDPEKFFKGLALAIDVPTQVIKDLIKVSLSLQSNAEAKPLKQVLTEPMVNLMFNEIMAKLKMEQKLQPFIKITDDSISAQFSYTNGGDLVINGVEYALDSEELRQLLQMAGAD